MRIVCILLYWLNIWNFLSFVFLWRSRRWKSVIGSFYLRKRGFAIFNFSYFSHRINVENCVNDSTWISQIIKRKTVAWKLDELNYHNIYFSQTGGRKIIFIFAGFLSILASLCNTQLPRLQIIICKNNHKLYLPLVYYSYSQVLPQSPFQWTIILCHNSAVCLFVILSQASQDILLQFFLLQTFDRIRLFWQSFFNLIFRCFIMSNFDSFINLL